ncbi:TetR/AcrR family transcriptional regulator [Kibdelosporangium persicum]|uniref:Regulatory protein TetR n=1 Tax=Kibdelosporangium persicum TaxID=2698649 RepID=A0ABX2F5B8_9PSEU|nr:TetR/AcrR family transcriptional regulator [Kibdelosporangium persicum]NRN66564.1 Regulatory protein TetR [Kibdelosporangium persicum]
MPAERNGRAGQVTSMELLWGDRAQPSRGPRPGLSVEKIATTAIEIADEEGLDALSMQRIASKLDYSAMSLYRYIPGKDQLIDVIYDTALGQPPADLGEDWRSGVSAWVRGMLSVYAQHPWLLRISVSNPPLGPNQLTWFNSLLELVSDIGLAEDEMVHLVMFATCAVRDLARVSTELAQGQQRSGGSVEEMGEGYALAMKRFVDDTRFHALAKVVSAGTFEPSDTPYNEIMPSLDFGLQRLLDGVESYVNSRKG